MRKFTSPMGFNVVTNPPAKVITLESIQAIGRVLEIKPQTINSAQQIAWFGVKVFNPTEVVTYKDGVFISKTVCVTAESLLEQSNAND
jgi:hypothetical protein